MKRLEEIEGSLCLPGRLRARIGSAADFRKLARFHYTARAPASFAGTVAIDFVEGNGLHRPIAVGVLSYPALNCRARENVLRLERAPRQWKWLYLNRQLRTISRVIVHPQFRGIGLASATVELLLRQAPTRYVEAISRMARFHPLFAKAGMKRVFPGDDVSPAYYLYDQTP